eukprot:213414_1
MATDVALDATKIQAVPSKSVNTPDSTNKNGKMTFNLHHCWRLKHNEESMDYKLSLLVLISRIIPIGAALCAIGYIIYLLANSDNWSTNINSEDSEILRREASRGLFVSVLIAILLNCIGAFMFYIKVREGLVVVNYGFILGPVIGFLLDQAIGT